MTENKIEIFTNKEFGSVRTMVVDGEIWFVGKDVAASLGYSNTSKAVITHVDEDDKTFVMLNIADSQNGNVPIGQSKTALINESGVYSLIFSSKLPTAKKFKHWVTAEVLPTKITIKQFLSAIKSITDWANDTNAYVEQVMTEIKNNGGLNYAKDRK